MASKTTTHIKQFFERRKQLQAQGVKNELSVREAFKELLANAAEGKKWTLVVEQRVEGTRNIPDGTLRDGMTIPRGYWEAKDSDDDLDAEIAKKLGKGYPASNIIFENSQRAVLIQSGTRVGEFDLEAGDHVATLLDQFLSYTEPNIVGFERAVEKFREDTPKLSDGLRTLIQSAHKTNKAFIAAYADFFALCQHALNPNISRDAVDEMLIQHLLTERLMRTVFNLPEFARRNAIAAEIEKVIDALSSRSFSRDEFIGQLGYFYEAIEAAARTLRGFSEKQTFINNVYERFFQGFAVKVADTHGIVYTPQPIVDFMCAAVEEVLRDEFDLSLADDGVCIIDPCTGTGNFIVNLLRRIHRADPARLSQVYRERLFANEVMLMPYYIAALNIEHAYMDLAGEYAPFEGLCFVDTLDLAEGAQMRMDFMTQANTARVQRQKAAPITVIIGNPPYNVGQLNENDNNKNRAYPVIDQRVRETYARDSKATLRMQLYDPYVKFFRWASDRLQGRDGIVCYVSNNGFVDATAFDGMRKHLLQDFTTVYHLDLHGDVRKNPKISGTSHNVFGIQVGVGITVAIRSSKHDGHCLLYHRVPEMARKEEKLRYLTRNVEDDGIRNALNTVEWLSLEPNDRYIWRQSTNTGEFGTFAALGKKDARNVKGRDAGVIFKTYIPGVMTGRDDVVYDFARDILSDRVERFSEAYNLEVDRLKRKPAKDIDEFVNYSQLKWSRNLKRALKGGQYIDFSQNNICSAFYRPFTKKYLYYSALVVDQQSRFSRVLPKRFSQQENRLIWLKVGAAWSMFALISDSITDWLPQGGSQCFPFYVYDEDGSNRRENITDWALDQFRAHYADPAISKWDIFYYVYALLHHPGYRQRYADNLKRELPRIPFVPAAPDFQAFAAAGRQLADLHLHYETVTPYPLAYQWTPGKPVDWRVTKMRLNKDKTALVVNPALTLAGIPAAAFEYKLGNRSALEWVIDQYQVKTDARSGITSDPNRYSDDEKYIVELVGRVVQVSVETARIVGEIGARAFASPSP